MPRPLTEREKAVLQFLLSPQFPGVDDLRDQAMDVLAEDELSDPSISLVSNKLRAKQAVGVLANPVRALTTHSLQDPQIVQLFLFVRDGWLDMIDLTWYGDEMPTELPDPSSFRPPEVIAGVVETE
jgi:hypothetical protein